MELPELTEMDVHKTVHGFRQVVEDCIEACNRRIMPELRDLHDDKLGGIERYVIGELPGDRATIIIIMVNRLIPSVRNVALLLTF
jgi:hypothetical protein